MMSKLTSAIALGIGLAVIPVTAARAQVGGFGDAAKGASDAAKKGVIEGVEVRSGLGTPVATVTGPTGAASPIVVSPSAAASPTPAAPPTNAASPGSAGAASPAAEDGMGKVLMDQAGKKARDEAGKRMGPNLP